MKINPADVKIILAEDAKTMRKIEIGILTSLGYTDVIEAEDGLEAKKLLQNRKGVSLIISDWNMPNMSGYELLTWMRTKSKNFTKTPFIMATAQSDKAQADKAKTAGANAIVAKPFTADELKEKIEQTLDPGKAKKKSTVPGVFQTASGKTRLRVAHLPITDHLLLGLLKDQIEQGKAKPKNFELETNLYGGWNPVVGALENNEVDAAFILAPIAMDLFAHKVPINTVLLAHRGGSIMVRNAKGKFNLPYEDFFKKKSFLIPHKLSIHHMLSHMFFKGIGLNASLDKGEDVDVNFEVAAPVDMPQFLAKNEQMAGFMVAEPIGSKAVNTGIAKRQFMSNELWPDHPCCLVAMRKEFIQNSPDSTREFVKLLVDAGQKISENVKAAAATGVKFLDPQGKLGLTEAVLEKVITDPDGIRWDNLYPEVKEFETIREYMNKELGVLKEIDYKKFVNYKFADLACKGRKKLKTIKLPPSQKTIEHLLNRDIAKAAKRKEQTSLSQLLFEKGVHAKNVVAPSQLQELVETQKKLEQENKTLLAENKHLNDQLAQLDTKAATLFKEGVGLLKNGNLFEAAGLFNAVLSFEPDNLKALNNLAVIYFEMELYDRAKSTLKKILVRDPENEIARENLESLI